MNIHIHTSQFNSVCPVWPQFRNRTKLIPRDRMANVINTRQMVTIVTLKINILTIIINVRRQKRKVSKFRKQILLFSFEPKNERFFLISALRIFNRSNQKIKGAYYVKYPHINIIKCIYFFDATHFLRLGQKSKNNFVRFLVQMRSRKFAFQMN